jgi:hypothetical protein
MWHAQAQEKQSGEVNVNQNAFTHTSNVLLNKLQDQPIKLVDGCRLGYAEYGAPDSTPVLFFHGSRHIHTDMANIAARRNVRLITVDHPGYKNDCNPGPLEFRTE